MRVGLDVAPIRLPRLPTHPRDRIGDHRPHRLDLVTRKPLRQRLSDPVAAGKQRRSRDIVGVRRAAVRMIVGQKCAQIVDQPRIIGTTRRDLADFGVEVSQPPRTARRVRLTFTEPAEPSTCGNVKSPTFNPASSPARKPVNAANITANA